MWKVKVRLLRFRDGQTVRNKLRRMRRRTLRICRRCARKALRGALEIAVNNRTWARASSKDSGESEEAGVKAGKVRKVVASEGARRRASEKEAKATGAVTRGESIWVQGGKDG